MNIGSAIKSLRKSKGLSQLELSIKINISANALCQIEKDNTFPSKITLRKICEVLETPISFLLISCVEENEISEKLRPTFIVLRNILLTV